jgi:hypothetical protein
MPRGQVYLPRLNLECSHMGSHEVVETSKRSPIRYQFELRHDAAKYRRQYRASSAIFTKVPAMAGTDTVNMCSPDQ